MSRVRLLFLLVAVVASGIVAWMLAAGLVGRSTTEVVEVTTVPVTEILVANQDMAMGELLLETKAGWREWPQANVTPTMITKDKMPDAVTKLKTARVRTAVFEGEPIAEKKLIQPETSGFMSAILPKGMRAISVPIAEPSAAAGFILPNDRVDVLLTTNELPKGAAVKTTTKTTSRSADGKVIETTQEAAGAERVGNTETVLTNVRILAINQVYRQEVTEERVTVTEGRTALLELDPFMTQVITSVLSKGQLSLTLRSIAEHGEKGTEEGGPKLASKYTSQAAEVNLNEIRIVRAGLETLVAVDSDMPSEEPVQ